MTTLIDQVLPRYQFVERHEITTHATAKALLDAITIPGTVDDPWARRFILIREIPARLMLMLGGKNALKNRPSFDFQNFTLLGRDDDREMVFGLIGQFWRADYGQIPCDGPETFTRFTQPNIPKLVINFGVKILANGQSRLTTETRVFCNDRASQLRFLPYWWLIRPVSGLLRRRMLVRICAAASI